MKVGFISLGCAKNLVDSEYILGVLQAAGIEIVNEIETADVIMINTCGFIDPAKKETLATITEMHELGKRIVVLGCYAERYRQELQHSMPFIERIITLRDYPRIHLILDDLFHDPSLKFQALRYDRRILSGNKETPYIKIGDGCDNRCTYCAIPLIRGSYHSREFSEIIDECRHLVKNGARELNLISQDTSRYGSDFIDPTSLVELIREISRIEGVWMIRLLYLYPDEITDELIEEVKNNPLVAHYFDIPIQHIEPSILKRMNRRGDDQYLKELWTKIRIKIPDAILRTTLIVGFPGETESDFLDLVRFVTEYPSDRLGAFAYSQEEDTAAYAFPDQIDEDVKSQRLDRIMRIQKQISRKLARRKIGTIQETLIESYDEETGFYYGRSYAFAPDDVDGYIVFQSEIKHHTGDIVKVKIKEAIMYDLLGDAIIEE